MNVLIKANLILQQKFHFLFFFLPFQIGFNPPITPHMIPDTPCRDLGTSPPFDKAFTYGKFVCLLHTQHFYVLIWKILSCSKQKTSCCFLQKKILKISMIIFSHQQMSAKVATSLNQLNSVKKRMRNLQTAAMIFHQV